MNSNAHTVKTRQDLNICLADRRQSATAGNEDEEEECAHTRRILLHIHTYPCARETEMRDTSSRPLLSLPRCLRERERRTRTCFLFTHQTFEPSDQSFGISLSKKKKCRLYLTFAEKKEVEEKKKINSSRVPFSFVDGVFFICTCTQARDLSSFSAPRRHKR